MLTHLGSLGKLNSNKMLECVARGGVQVALSGAAIKAAKPALRRTLCLVRLLLSVPPPLYAAACTAMLAPLTCLDLLVRATA